VAVTRRLRAVGRAADGPVADPAGSIELNSDEQVLARVARGDEAAFEVLYDRFAPAVYGMVRSVLRDPAQSEEVAYICCHARYLALSRSAVKGSPTA